MGFISADRNQMSLFGYSRDMHYIYLSANLGTDPGRPQAGILVYGEQARTPHPPLSGRRLRGVRSLTTQFSPWLGDGLEDSAIGCGVTWAPPFPVLLSRFAHCNSLRGEGGCRGLVPGSRPPYSTGLPIQQQRE